MVKQLFLGKSLLKIVALIFVVSICFCSTEVFASSKLIQNDTFWKDTDGNTIYSQGGGILKEGDTYYWYGVKYNYAVDYFNNPTTEKDEEKFYSVTCYSSKDLLNWKFENDVITEAELNDIGRTTGWVGRLGVFYNESTNKYVLCSQYKDQLESGRVFATADTPTGKFTFDHVNTGMSGVVNNGTGDQTIFTDDDGKSYLICSSASGRQYLYVVPFSEDGLSFGTPTQVSKSAGREGNCMFKYNGHYYFASSNLHGWNASQCYYMKSESDNILGPYEEEQVMLNSDKDFCHVSQTGFFTNITGSEGTTVLFCGDRWSDFAGNGIGYNQWCPVSFDGETPIFNSVSEFNLDTEKGTWSVGSDNNYILNPSFEADRVSSTTLAGWTYESNITDTTPTINNKAHYYSGNFSMVHWDDADYQATTYQDITDIPNGTYTLKAWVRSSGKQKTCNIFIKDFGGEEKDYAIKSTINDWKEITIYDVSVTNGKCQVGVYSDASANQWCYVDNFSLIKNP